MDLTNKLLNGEVYVLDIGPSVNCPEGIDLLCVHKVIYRGKKDIKITSKEVDEFIGDSFLASLYNSTNVHNDSLIKIFLNDHLFSVKNNKVVLHGCPIVQIVNSDNKEHSQMLSELKNKGVEK